MYGQLWGAVQERRPNLNCVGSSEESAQGHTVGGEGSVCVLTLMYKGKEWAGKLRPLTFSTTAGDWHFPTFLQELLPLGRE